MKRIIYIGNFKEFYATENYIAFAFEKLGFEVIRVPQDRIPNAKVVLNAVFKYKPEFVMFSKWGNARETIALLRQNKILTVGWIFDLYFGLPSEFGQRNINNGSFQCDICFVTDGGNDRVFKEHGINAKLLRQGIHTPEAKEGTRSPHEPIIFLGTYNYEKRKALVDFLKKNYQDDFVVYGQGGDKQPVRGMKLNDVLASAKIVVGDSVPADYYWSNRIYEVLGRGGFLIHPEIKGLDEEIKPGKHFVPFKHGDFADLKNKIQYYLEHDEEREAIRRAGHLYVKSKYTYTDRCRELLRQVAEHKSKYHK